MRLIGEDAARTRPDIILESLQGNFPGRRCKFSIFDTIRQPSDYKKYFGPILLNFALSLLQLGGFFKGLVSPVVGVTPYNTL